jgi:hypothetical protein
MALTIVVPGVTPLDLSSINSPVNVKYAKITGDASYPQATGYVLPLATIGFSNKIVAVQSMATTGTMYATWDQVNLAVRFLSTTPSVYVEAVSGSNQSGVTLDVAVWGY